MDIQNLDYRHGLLLLAALCAGMGIYSLSGQLLTLRSQNKAVRAFMGGVEGDTPQNAVRIGSRSHQIRLFFAKYNLDATGRESLYATIGRVFCAMFGFFVVQLLGMPLLVCLVGVPVGVLFFDGLIDNQWRSLKNAIAKELPVFLTRFGSIQQTTPNVIEALLEVSSTLDESGQLVPLLERYVRLMQEGGGSAMQLITDESTAISRDLGLTMILVARLRETGGGAYAATFRKVADSMGSIMEARADGAAKAAEKRGAVRMIVVIMVLFVGYMLKYSQLSSAFADPKMQFMYLVIAGLVGVGVTVMDKQIDEALQQVD